MGIENRDLGDLFSLRRKIAVVTGGASGLGRAAAVGLARYGADIALFDLNIEACDEIKTEIESFGRRVLIAECNIASASSLEAAVDHVVESLGGVDILFNAAGITKRVPSVDIHPDDFRRVIDVDLNGSFLAAQAVGRVMVERRSGSIILVSSIAGFGAMGRGNAAYSAAKAGVIGLTRELAIEWAPFGVRVNAIAPVQFKTPFIQSVLDDKALTERMIAKIPLGRMGEPEDIVGPTIFLASEASAMVTGHILAVDGGYLAQ